VGTPAWFLNGKILRRHTFGLFQIWMLDLLTPVFRRIDPFLPFPGLSLIAVLERKPIGLEAERGGVLPLPAMEAGESPQVA
jgi:hypothetical protein